MTDVERVGVVGCGLMGSGIAQVAARAGFTVTVLEVSDEQARKGREAIERFLEHGVERGRLDASERDATLSRIRTTIEIEDLADCDVVIEAVVEALAAKQNLFAELDRVLREDALRLTNTSSLSITELGAGSRHPDRLLGLHFFNPVPLMKVVEVIPGLATDPERVEQTVAFAKRLGKTPVLAPDRPGFLVNRLLVPYLLDAVRLLEEGAASASDIDSGMKLGCGHPMGPLELLDFVGLDTACAVANIMYDAFREQRFAPPPLLRRMVLAGRLGRKSGRGFYEYDD